ncbi:MAG: UDP-N-acetylmuramoyl-tripeptide--D-alanyl-D-alanine ligase [Syntrophorhabdaceae bacterium]|nr:UDP-N-acetylmuramoyl-tripeptide--D-alanyl-D-alanine ligase [Syntrophorhabdaceae bacterium]
MWSIEEIVKAVNGIVITVEQETFTGISTDSRTIKEGELFIPLKGERFDGHDYLEGAYARSRGGVLCEKSQAKKAEGIKGTVVLVEDTLDALLALAKKRREKIDTPCVGITGSNGKTTTKELLVNMTKRAFFVHFNEKNYNNLIGVPKSILSMEKRPDLSIFELGTNSRGEIRRLAEVVKPDVSLITNINPSHLEGLSDIKGILEEKLDLFRFTVEGGLILINMDDPHLSSVGYDDRHKAATYSMERPADFTLAVEEHLGWNGYVLSLTHKHKKIKAKTSLLGKHNLYNILAAYAIACSVETPQHEIEEGIETFEPYDMRFRPVKTKRGYLLVDDTYNANPSSVKWAVKTITELPCQGKRIVVLGDMKELGSHTGYYHREVIDFLKGSGIDGVFLTGEEMGKVYDKGKGMLYFEDKKELIRHVLEKIEDGDVVLVKGSRAERMDEIVEALK